MIELALVGEHYNAQIQENPQELSGIQVVWCGKTLDQLRAEADGVKPRVFVCDLRDLGDDPRGELDRLLGLGKIELVVVTYDFARRDLIQSLQSERVRLVQGPLSLSNLRAQMLNLIIRDILGQEQEAPADQAPTPAPSGKSTPGVGAPLSSDAQVPPRQFSKGQLARLMEIASAVECECPNHLSRVVNSLLGFEDYSADCESINEADARVHRMLYTRTAQARAIMEDALKELMEHEQITL